MTGEKRVARGLVLRATETKEADLILTVLTAEEGRTAVVARGARRRGSKLAASCQLFAYSEMVLRERNGWLLLDEAELLTLFGGLREDVTLLALASYFAELTESITAAGSPAEEILPLLLNALYALGELRKPPDLVKAAFELKLLSLSGYAPLTDACAVCRAREPQMPLFDFTQGLLFCRDCRQGSGTLLPLDAGSLAAMRHILRENSKKMLNFSLSDESGKRLSAVCERFAQSQLERNFSCLDFYKKLSLSDGRT